MNIKLKETTAPPSWKVPDFNGNDGTTRTKQRRDDYPPVAEDVSQNVTFIVPEKFSAPPLSSDDSIRDIIDKVGTLVSAAIVALETMIELPQVLQTDATSQVSDGSIIEPPDGN